MAKQIKKILIIHDHPIIAESYQNILMDSENENYQFFIEKATSIEGSYNKLKISLIEDTPYHFIFLDINLPPAESLKLYSGDDLGIKIREISPFSQIVVMTMHTDSYRLYHILKELNPDAFLIKTDTTPDDFKNAFIDLLEGKIYYSQKITSLLRKQFTQKFTLDNIDREILYYLSKGINTKDLEEYIPLSLPAIEKRKKELKKKFGVENRRNDLMLIQKAKKSGFL